MTAAVESNQTKPWVKEQIPFNFWYRKRLQADFGTILTLVDVTRDVIKNDGSKDEMYQTFIANLQEAQARLTQLLFELEETDMELALKINDTICSTLDWAKKSEVSSLLPEIPSTKEVTTLVSEMLKEKKLQFEQFESTDEKKIEDLIDIELQVGVREHAVKRNVYLPRGSTLVDLTNTFKSLKKRSQITYVRQGLKVEDTTVLLKGDSIIAVLADVDGPFEGFDDPEEKIEPPVVIAPLAPPPQEKKKPTIPTDSGFKDLLSGSPAPSKQVPVAENLDSGFQDLLSSAPAPSKQVPVAENLDFLNFGAKTTSEKKDIAEDTAVQPDMEDKANNNPFDPLIEVPKTGISANPFEDYENEESEPLISFDRFSIGGSAEPSKEIKEVKDATEEDSLLGDNNTTQHNVDLKKEDSFPKFAGFS